MSDEDAAEWLEVLAQTEMPGYRASIKDAVAHAILVLRKRAADRPMHYWSAFENSLIVGAVNQIVHPPQQSIYSQIKELKSGPLSHRTWEAIRARINRELGERGVIKRGRPLT